MIKKIMCHICDNETDKENSIETMLGMIICDSCDTKRIIAETDFRTYYYIDFKDKDIYSNEGEREYNEQDKHNIAIGNHFLTFYEAKKCLEDIINKNNL